MVKPSRAMLPQMRLNRSGASGVHHYLDGVAALDQARLHHGGSRLGAMVELARVPGDLGR